MDAEFEARKRASVAQLLFKAARLWNEAAVARVAALGAPGLRVAHTQLFPHLSPEGIRLTELAHRVGVTKQAVGPLVADLEAMGVLERAPDPADGRAILVRLTPRGREAMMHGLGVLQDMERELTAALPPATMSTLHDALLALNDLLEPPKPP